MYTEEDITRIFVKDRKDFYKSTHLVECASDDESDGGGKGNERGNERSDSVQIRYFLFTFFKN